MQQICSPKTNIVISITILKSSESCHDIIEPKKFNQVRWWHFHITIAIFFSYWLKIIMCVCVNIHTLHSKKVGFPSGNIELRRNARGNAISVVQLWIICVISQNWRPDVRCGDVMTRMLKSTWCAAGASFFVIQQSSLCVSVECVLWVCYYQDRK